MSKRRGKLKLVDSVRATIMLILLLMFIGSLGGLIIGHMAGIIAAMMTYVFSYLTGYRLPPPEEVAKTCNVVGLVIGAVCCITFLLLNAQKIIMENFRKPVKRLRQKEKDENDL